MSKLLNMRATIICHTNLYRTFLLYSLVKNIKKYPILTSDNNEVYSHIKFYFYTLKINEYQIVFLFVYIPYRKFHIVCIII